MLALSPYRDRERGQNLRAMCPNSNSDRVFKPGMIITPNPSNLLRKVLSARSLGSQ